jgi:hypothetical protein
MGTADNIVAMRPQTESGPLRKRDAPDLSRFPGVVYVMDAVRVRGISSSTDDTRPSGYAPLDTTVPQAPGDDAADEHGALLMTAKKRAVGVARTLCAVGVGAAVFVKLLLLVFWHSIRYPLSVSVIDYDKRTVYLKNKHA